eukprot:4844580-Pyramimonas_sp.AAC.1
MDISRLAGSWECRLRFGRRFARGHSEDTTWGPICAGICADGFLRWLGATAEICTSGKRGDLR